MSYTEFPVFPMMTYDKKYDSPEKAKWKIVVSIPPRKIKKFKTPAELGIVYRVGDWLVIVWGKDESVRSREANEITLYETSEGNQPPTIKEVEEARIQAIWRQGWATLITVPLRMKGIRRRRHSGAIVEGDNSIQIWLRL